MENSMIEFIKQKLETRRKVYLTDSNLILEDYRKEKEKIEEYNGRQLLEMLQNADDEAITDKEKTCFIKLTENLLTIANNGRRFSEGGIESLMYSNISPKVLEQNKVGQKGLGFRSILSWASKITIKSYEFAVEFSEANAIEFLETLIKESPKIKSELSQKEKNIEFPIATLRCPKILEEIPNNLTTYDTYIIINLKEEQTKEVQEQINNEINKEVLLFLNNLERIIVESPERNYVIEKETKDTKTIIREINNDNQEKVEKVWNLKVRKGLHQSKNYELKIAWKDNLDDKIGRLYSYFKTNVKFPYPALIHGTFDLTSDRNHFTPKSEHNIFLVDELIQLLIDTSLEISHKEISYKPLKLLCIHGKEGFDTFFEDNNFPTRLKSKIRESKIFPTISNHYLSFENRPVFYKRNYAEILPKKRFPNLMLYSEDADIIEMIGWLGIQDSFEQEYLFQTISEISDQLTLKHRSSLISYIINDFGKSDIAKSDLPNIFIDQDNIIIRSDSEIFLPPSGERIEIPIKLNLKIINSRLFSSLKNIFGSEKAEVIEDRLKIFGVKVYRFGEIFRRIITDFNTKVNTSKSRRESLKDLMSNLYDLYILNKDKESIDISIPSNISIPILNKNNGETKVSDIYLGKEYNNKLCEILYEYDKAKLVGSPKILGLEGKENVSEFIQWLGVAKLPRKKLVNGEHEYAHQAIKKFPYKEKNIYWYDSSLTSYNKLKQKGYWLNEVKVESIEDLEDILNNNTNENILYWLNCDNRITEITETNPNSQIKFSISSKQYFAHVNNGDLPSYLLWKIKQINWIETETEKKVKPSDCCTSKTIRKDFSPFIEIPKIQYDHHLFKEGKISKDIIEYLLLKIGVNKAISDFGTDTIYSMLLNLPDIDKEGIKAKMIYNELAENIEDSKIDKNSTHYQSFIGSGLVLCKKEGNYLYESVKKAYYVEDKTFGEEIINQFATIEIDRRKGARKINTIFGVTPLENLEFSLKSPPVIYKLNEIFQKEIDLLKPYIYAFRLSKDTDGKELNWVKNSKITLCTKIQPSYIHNGELRDFELKPFEFIYIEKKNEVYLLVNDNDKYRLIEDFKSDYQFADSVAEIYCSILKVDLHRVSFSRLFEANSEKRNHIIKTELDDINLDKLKSAKKKLNIVDDPKIQFWFSILSTVNKDYENRKYKDDELTDLIHSQIGLNLNDFKFDFENINDTSYFSSIVALFTELHIDISEFNKNSTVALNIIPYYEECIHQLKNDFQKSFETILFYYLENKTLEEKEKFLNLISDYETFNHFELENTIKIDVNGLFTSTIKNEFKIDLLKEHVIINPTDIYNKNKIDLINQIFKVNKTLLNDILENDKTLSSLIHFAEYEKTLKEYNIRVEKIEDKKEINFNNKTIKTTPDNFEELYLLITGQDPITKIEKINSSKPEFQEGNDKRGRAKGSKNSHLSDSDKETLGFIGEVIVLESLKKKFGLENVIWDSGFAKKAGINPKGDNDKHYDIKYKDNRGKWNFVEVKTTASDKLEFKISGPEVTFGVENKSNYEIMIVTDALDDKKIRRIKRLVYPFKFDKDESFTNNSKFLVKNENFIIKLNEE